MDTGRNDLLGEIAADAALERSDFLVQSTDQLRRFLDRHKERIAAYGGLTLIDEEPDYLSIAARLQRSAAGAGISGRPDRRLGQRDRGHRDGRRARRAVQPGRHLRRVRRCRPGGRRVRRDADRRRTTCSMPPGSRPRRRSRSARTRTPPPPTRGRRRSPAETALDDDEAAARRLYDLALEFQERSQRSEARLLDEFEVAAATASDLLGDLVIVDDDDERLVLTGSRIVPAEVVPEEAEGEWRTLSGPDELVEFYDPTDVFGDLADALAEAYPRGRPGLRRDRRWRRLEDAEVDADDLEGEAETAEEDTGDERRSRPWSPTTPTTSRRRTLSTEDAEGSEGRPTA